MAGTQNSSSDNNKQRIVLGSGKLYIKEFEGDAVPERTEMEKDENLLGLIQGGAAVEYKPETYTAEDDLGLVSKTILTKEEVTFKSGIMTWNGNTLIKLCSTARVKDSPDGKGRTVKIGGVGNQDGKRYVIFFIHEDKADGDIIVAIVGKNTAGFTMSFAKDKETVIDAEFKAEALDKEGTKVIYTEQIAVE
jgi:hypothetical protein